SVVTDVPGSSQSSPGNPAAKGQDMRIASSGVRLLPLAVPLAGAMSIRAAAIATSLLLIACPDHPGGGANDDGGGRDLGPGSDAGGPFTLQLAHRGSMHVGTTFANGSISATAVASFVDDVRNNHVAELTSSGPCWLVRGAQFEVAPEP